MKINCSACQHEINIPDDKVPEGQAFNLTCPSCKEKVRVDQHLKSDEPEETIDAFSFATSDDFEEEEVLEIYDEDDKVALVLDQENGDFWVNTLNEMHFKLQTANSEDHAIHKIKFTEFDLIILHENFQGTPFRDSPVYKYLINLPMNMRRHIFFVLTGKEFKSMNNMEAFALSANVLINENDFDKAKVILKKSMSDNDQFYKVFRESLNAHGKV
ncbi:MAG: hypothetical protein G3M70_02810 [Candidatus Nitronauta litoralis]|uniref:Zinc finger/thioredoxin putative domain-containing protein n=1 Tax=Candidatus Nitronauta litoralis TaxID=2705533 RepID=A0A7T0FZH9_9BACT|nr:MAG: hypothetical protein G3M70_02810 [Candidatus Nitronauta litoralis]